MPPVQLCVFDSRRGKAEGQEVDKVLAYYPADVPANVQANVVGLVQAVGAFSAIFSQVGLLMGQVKPVNVSPPMNNSASCGVMRIIFQGVGRAVHGLLSEGSAWI